MDISRISMENSSIISIGMFSLTVLFLKEIQHLLKGQIIMATLVVLIDANYTCLVVIIFNLTVLDFNRPIP